MQILTTLQAGKNYTVSDLSKMFGTSRRTIFRDLKELQAIGVPYRYDTRTGGYMIEPEFFLPPIDLSLQEAMSLLLLAHKAKDQIQLPFKNNQESFHSILVLFQFSASRRVGIPRVENHRVSRHSRDGHEWSYGFAQPGTGITL